MKRLFPFLAALAAAACCSCATAPGPAETAPDAVVPIVVRVSAPGAETPAADADCGHRAPAPAATPEEAAGRYLEALLRTGDADALLGVLAEPDWSASAVEHLTHNLALFAKTCRDAGVRWETRPAEKEDGGTATVGFLLSEPGEPDEAQTLALRSADGGWKVCGGYFEPVVALLCKVPLEAFREALAGELLP